MADGKISHRGLREMGWGSGPETGHEKARARRARYLNYFVWTDSKILIPSYLRNMYMRTLGEPVAGVIPHSAYIRRVYRSLAKAPGASSGGRFFHVIEGSRKP